MGVPGFARIFLQYPRLIPGASSWRPRHGPAAEHVRVYVRDGLPGVIACIKDNAIPGLSDALSRGYLVRLPGDLGQQPVGGDREASQVRIVRFRDDEHMNRGLRIDVTECKRALSFEHARGRDVAGHDFAE